MRPVRFSKILDFLPPIVAFVAAIVAVIGDPKWDAHAQGLAKITKLGWFVLGIGLLALASSLVITARNRRQQEDQAQRRERIAQIGMRELLKAVDHTKFPFKQPQSTKGSAKLRSFH